MAEMEGKESQFNTMLFVPMSICNFISLGFLKYQVVRPLDLSVKTKEAICLLSPVPALVRNSSMGTHSVSLPVQLQKH